ncbi:MULTISPECIES: LysR family transcriptional regulator [Paraburkholderia]|uniref:LysR family transcriptional regulator n=1 Tax=Paraburkholderia TaxID=1822464 RepID=UPI00224C9817|nr:MULTISPECIES: LysR family transcriptional regulator [Paraburkholderia]MCX4164047.1 LysR family transcriptional regulator [Paraburkholderia megapolitana]MDN7159542.1 LysR family transcriptional regulator [Paraburkholderia sp. CHISQ3]MDQ6496589.1 LysR family transcriptional regulator [Paraburkholderia megapolitana]
MIMLDLDAVRAFVLVADLHSFTRAADALDTTQSAVSLKLKRLETHLGKQLVERTPRLVRLTGDGDTFLVAARDLLSAHERALGALAVERRRLSLGLSEHVTGAGLPALLAKLNAYDPGLLIELHMGPSAALRTQFDERRLDAAIVRHEPDDVLRDDAQLLFGEALGWLASPDWSPRPGEPLPLALLAPPCNVRAVALKTLDDAGIGWREVFIGGGMVAVGAAVAAGLAISPLARRVAPRGLIDVGARLGLPTLPESRVTLYTRIRDPRSIETLRLVANSLAVQ